MLIISDFTTEGHTPNTLISMEKFNYKRLPNGLS